MRLRTGNHIWRFDDVRNKPCARQARKVIGITNSGVVKVKEIYEQNTRGIFSSSVYILCNRYRTILSPRWVGYWPTNNVKVDNVSSSLWYPLKDLKMQIFSTSLSFGKLEKKMNPNAAIVIFTKYLTSWDFNSLGKRLKVRQFFSIWLRHQTYCLSVTTVQLHEIQYTKVQGVPSISAKTKKKMVRGPYKRDQRVVQDEDCHSTRHVYFVWRKHMQIRKQHTRGVAILILVQ